MPIQSKIDPKKITAAEWLSDKKALRGLLEGKGMNAEITLIRYATEVIGEGPTLHVHPYDDKNFRKRNFIDVFLRLFIHCCFWKEYIVLTSFKIKLSYFTFFSVDILISPRTRFISRMLHVR